MGFHCGYHAQPGGDAIGHSYLSLHRHRGFNAPWESDPEVMRSALAAHDSVLDSVIHAHGGRLFKHTGDGVIAAFASPSSAVQAAIAAQLALELPVRMGLGTGEAQVQGDDYFGPTLNRAARVMSAGHGGQILVGETTERVIDGFHLLDLGSRRLRDLAETNAHLSGVVRRA